MERDGMKRVTFCRAYREREIIADVTITESGISTLLYGGDLPHIGAVGVADGAGKIEIHQFPGHKEGLLCQSWCRRLAAAGGPVVVSAGVHYDHATAEDIAAVVALSGELLEETAEAIASLH